MGPGPLALADMIYTGKRAVLFGGFNNTFTNQNTGIGKAFSGLNVKIWIRLLEPGTQWRMTATGTAQFSSGELMKLILFLQTHGNSE